MKRKHAALAMLTVSGLILLAPLLAFGEDVTPAPISGVWQWVLGLVTSLTSGQAAAVAIAAAQLALYIMRTSIGDFAGIWKIAVLYLVSALVMVLQGVSAGSPLLAVLGSAAVLAALQHSAREAVVHILEVVKLPDWLAGLLKMILGIA